MENLSPELGLWIQIIKMWFHGNQEGTSERDHMAVNYQQIRSHSLTWAKELMKQTLPTLTFVKEAITKLTFRLRKRGEFVAVRHLIVM